MHRFLPRTVIGVLAGFLLLIPAASFAIPELQLYLEDAYYDADSESWVIDQVDFDADETLRLWAIGNVAGPGGKGSITDVKLAVAYTSRDGVTIDIDGSQIDQSEFPGWTDPTPVPADMNTGVGGTPGWHKTESGTVPELASGDPISNLAPHGIYGDGTDWQEFKLGDFTLTDSPIADFIDAFPTTPVKTDAAHVNVYDVSVAGLQEGDFVHFDLYNSVLAGNKAKAVFAPFSHDGEVGTGEDGGDGGGGAGVGVVPEPATLVLLGTGLLGIGGVARRRSPRGTPREETEC